MRRTPLLIALAGTALGGCGAERAAQQTSTVVKTVTTSQGAPASTRARDTAPSLRRYEAEAYAVRVPANWTLEEDETPHEGYVESKWRDPNDPNSSITIDASASQAVSAASKAEEVRAAVEGEPSYSEQGFAPTSLGSYSDAFKWTFRLSGDQRIDYFMRECGTGVAVLDSTSPERFASMRPTFRRVAESLKVNCTGTEPPPPAPGPPTRRSAPSPDTGTPDTDFCATHDCIPSFDEGTGYIVKCGDGQWSHSGGRPGACSHHKGETSRTYP